MDVLHPHSEVVGYPLYQISPAHAKCIGVCDLFFGTNLKFPTFQSVPNKSKRLLNEPGFLPELGAKIQKRIQNGIAMVIFLFLSRKNK